MGQPNRRPFYTIQYNTKFVKRHVAVPEPASDGNKTPPQIDADGPTDESGKGTDTLSDPQTAMNNDEPPVTFPVISPQDYETDAEFVDTYRYLTTDELTNNARADKTTLIMADKYTFMCTQTFSARNYTIRA